MTLKLGMQHQQLEYYQVYSNDDRALNLTYLRQSQIWSTTKFFQMMTLC